MWKKGVLYSLVSLAWKTCTCGWRRGQREE
uniref:Uncharacterized protein n=1 Tax=Musa acuminata subsp. malaccensis TaxID=214687 RepID=A0A804JFC3_MUSAM